MSVPFPQAAAGLPVRLLVYFDDVDPMFGQSIAHGAIEKKPASHQFDADRVVHWSIRFGYAWTIASRPEEVFVDDITKCFAGRWRLRADQLPRPF